MTEKQQKRGDDEYIYIHKKSDVGFDIICNTVCGEKLSYKVVSYMWNKVDCPKCLKYKGIKLYKRKNERLNKNNN